jgi:predicted nucleic acid-binding protein
LKKESLYLDTSVISAYFDERTKERQEATINFWNNVLPNYQIYISAITVEELDNTRNDSLRIILKERIKDFEVLTIDTEIHNLAQAYINNNIFPLKYFDDALHVAAASFHRVTYLISWNFEHLVKVKTRKLVNLVNILNGAGEVEIISPQEL